MVSSSPLKKYWKNVDRSTGSLDDTAKPTFKLWFLTKRFMFHFYLFSVSRIHFLPFGYFLSSYLKSLGYQKILQGGKLDFFSSYTEAAQDFRDEVDTKEAKRFGWIKEYASPNTQSLATPAQSFPELTRVFLNP